MSDLQDLELIISAGARLLFIESDDEKEVEVLFGRLAMRLGRELLRWSVASGLVHLQSGQSSLHALKEPAKVLAEIVRRPMPSIYLMMDIHHWLDDPLTLRQLKEIALGKPTHTLVLVSHAAEIPDELRPLATKFELSLPDRAALEQLLQEESQTWGRQHKRTVKAHRDVVEALLGNLAGLTHNDARQLIRNAIYDDGMLTEDDLAELAKTKYRLLDNQGVLSLELDTAKFGQVAGLRSMKKWLDQRREVFLAAAPPRRPRSPQGHAAAGGTGGWQEFGGKVRGGKLGRPLATPRLRHPLQQVLR
jgi:hypothetical protein